MQIEVKKPSEQELNDLGVKSWPIWTKEESKFDWYYDEKETCYFLEGEVEVESEGNVSAKMEKGDLVIFPKGLKCVWHVIKPVRKHYNFG